MFGTCSKLVVSNTSMKRRSNEFVLLDSKHRLQNSIPTTTNYANVAYASLTYKMASATLAIASNSK